MNVTINGKQKVIEKAELIVVDVLKHQNVEMPDMVSVELNGTILKREEFSTTPVKEGDRIEFLYFMGGGE